MQMKITPWLKVAIGFQFLTAAVHSLSFLNKMQGKNEMEKQLINLMYNYVMDMGAGFHRSMSQLFIAVSACFTLIYLLGALINLYLMSKHAPIELIRDIVGIQTIIFGVVFIVVSLFAFLLPVAFTGIVFLLLIMSYLRLKPTK